MKYSVRSRLRHDAGVLGRCHIALVAAATLFYNSDAMEKTNAEGEAMAQLLMRRDPATADAFMDRLFVRADLPAEPFDFKEEDEEQADLALQVFFDAAVEQWMAPYAQRITPEIAEPKTNG